MTALETAMADVIAAFDAAGYPATDDVRNLNPPGVVVALPTINPRFGKHCAALEWTAYVIAANVGNPGQLAALSEYVGGIIASGIYAFTRAEPYDVQLPGGGDPAPSYRIEWTNTVPMEG